MKRNWDIIRDVLIEVAVLNSTQFEKIQYGPASESEEPEKDIHGVLLWKVGFIEGFDFSDMDGEAIQARCEAAEHP